MADTSRLYQRAQGLVVVRGAAGLTAATPGRPVVRIDGGAAGGVAALLRAAVAPVRHADAVRLADAATVRSLLVAGVLVPAAPAAPAGGALDDARPCGRLVLGIAGGIGAVHTPRVVLDLARGFAREVDVVVTQAAARLTRPSALEHLGVRTWRDPWAVRDGVHVPHIQLAQAADLVVVLYATAHTLFRLAHGAASDLLSLVVAATEAPVVVVPGMNHVMWDHPPVQRNVAQLRADGVFVVEPGPGHEAADGPGGVTRFGAAGLGSGDALPRALADVLRQRIVRRPPRPVRPRRRR